jgi:DNA polymerase-3 subunit alpha
MFDYIFKRYGKDYVALCGAYTTFQGDSIIRELGKVYGLPDEEIKALQKSGQPGDIGKNILQYGRLLQDFPNIQSIHPCGVLISEQKLSHWTASFMPPKGFAGAHIDMFVAEEIGLNKFDILSQRGLSHIKDCEGIIWKIVVSG